MNNDLRKQMQDYCRQTDNENTRIHRLLVDFVKSVGGKVNTENREKHYISTLYAYAYDEFTHSYTEYEVDEVRVVDDNLEIHLPYYSGNEDDQWLSVLGGMLLINATLYNLCDCLPDYA